jgi:hypothetical protein
MRAVPVNNLKSSASDRDQIIRQYPEQAAQTGKARALSWRGVRSDAARQNQLAVQRTNDELVQAYVFGAVGNVWYVHASFGHTQLIVPKKQLYRLL